MKQLEIYQKIADAVNAAAGSKNPKMTIVTESEFGGVYFLHINAHSADIKPYAQYKDALTIYFKKRGGRSVYGMRVYGTKPVAIFSGWQETTWEQPRSFLCFDKNMFYGLVDGFPQEQKIAEESERVHLSEIQQKGKVYKVVSMNPDDPQPRMIVETYETAEDLKKHLRLPASSTAHRAGQNCRARRSSRTSAGRCTMGRTIRAALLSGTSRRKSTIF